MGRRGVLSGWVAAVLTLTLISAAAPAPARADSSAALTVDGLEYRLVQAWDTKALVEVSGQFQWFNGSTWSHARLPICGSSCAGMKFGGATQNGILAVWYQSKFARYNLTDNSVVADSEFAVPDGAEDIQASSTAAIYRLDGQAAWHFIDLDLRSSVTLNVSTQRLLIGTEQTGVVAWLTESGEVKAQPYADAGSEKDWVSLGAVTGTLNEMRATGNHVLWSGASGTSPDDPGDTQFCVLQVDPATPRCTSITDGEMESFALGEQGFVVDLGNQVRWYPIDNLSSPLPVHDDGYAQIFFPLRQESGDTLGLFLDQTTITLRSYHPTDESLPKLADVRGGDSALIGAMPGLSGWAAVGKHLTVVVNRQAWFPAHLTFSYQWYRNGVAISGATSAAYYPVAADVGARLHVVVKATRSGFASAQRSSGQVVGAWGAFTHTPRPAISGTKKVGRTLRAVPGVWRPGPVALRYQWYRSGKAIKGATRSSYTLTRSDRRKTITVKVTGFWAGYRTVAMVSKATSTVK